MQGLKRVTATRYVLPLREGGSLPALVEADDDGLYVLKLRGAGQGLPALVAELIVGELARTIGLRVPELVIADLDPELAAAEPDPEIQDLLQASAGLNAGLDFLPSALPYSEAADGLELGPALAAAVVWLDALTLNVDRTARNPNLLVWHRQLWLIDHGAALYPHHADRWPNGAAATPMPQIAEHVLLAHAGSLIDVHGDLAPLLDDDALERIVGSVPEDWFAATGTTAESYVTFLRDRLGAGVFATEAEAARQVVAGG